MEKINGHSDDDVVFSVAMQLACCSVLPMALRTAVDLGLIEIIAASGHDFISATEIASRIKTKNAHAPMMVERILRFLASSSVLKCEVTKTAGGEELLYGLSPVCKYFVGDHTGASLASHLLMDTDKNFINVWYHLKDAIVEGGTAFIKAHGMSGFELMTKDEGCNIVFNQAMRGMTTLIMNKMLDVYKGFEGLTQIIDVGGGTGGNLAAIVSKYPHIKGINYDLPHVIKDAPSYQGVEHVAGDMFEIVPSAEAIFLKFVLHDWSDDECLVLLRNCWKALPESGKIIVVEALLPQFPNTDEISNNAFCHDIYMLLWSPGAKERTHREYDVLARKAGFARTEVICNAGSKYLIEFYKM